MGLEEEKLIFKRNRKSALNLVELIKICFAFTSFNQSPKHQNKANSDWGGGGWGRGLIIELEGV